MSSSLLLRSTLPRYIARKPTLAGAVWLRKARASSSAAAQEEGEFKYVPGGREFPPLLVDGLGWVADPLFLFVWLFALA